MSSPAVCAAALPSIARLRHKIIKWGIGGHEFDNRTYSRTTLELLNTVCSTEVFFGDVPESFQICARWDGGETSSAIPTHHPPRTQQFPLSLLPQLWLALAPVV